MDILYELKSKSDEKRAIFTAKLVPNVERERFLGLKTAEVDEIAKKLVKSGEHEAFLSEKHYYFEEFGLHADILCRLKYETKEELCSSIENFLPLVNNWAVCDSLAQGMKGIKKYPTFFREKCKEWIASEDTFKARFGVVVLLSYFLDEAFDERDLSLLAKIDRNEFYLQMALAWYWSVALVKQYEKAVPYFEKRMIKDEWVHNKGIQKARESFRVSNERKAYLIALKLPKSKNRKS
ncbi:MAG: DNA alkylation repair protein [Clostridia bacterium]|nr:DNA alkylation repair protein [Clostridia bacterium]